MRRSIDIRMIRRWKEVQHIHEFLSNNHNIISSPPQIKKKNGSIEYAISRVGSRYIKCNDFVISIMDEFGIQPPTIQIEKHLRSFYKTFSGSEKGRVDSCALLCTYLSITFSQVIQYSSKRVFNGFCNIYASVDDDFNGYISIQDVINVLSTGCISLDDFDQCKEMIVSSIQSISQLKRLDQTEISWTMLDNILDHHPSILIRFRDQILGNLHEEKRIEILKSREDASSYKFNQSLDRLILKRAIMIWNHVLYKSFDAWAALAKEESKSRLLDMRMRYWKANRILTSWKKRVIRSKKLQVIFHFMTKRHNMDKKLKFFKRWVLITKIQKACYKQSNRFKNIALGLTFLRIIRFNSLKKAMFYNWISDVQFQKKMEWALEMNFDRILKKFFTRWKSFYLHKIMERNAADHKRWATTTIQSILESRTREIQHKSDEDETVINRSEQMIAIIRDHYVADIDRKILNEQQDSRRQRDADERKYLLLNWHDYWKKVEVDRIDKVTKDSKRWLISTRKGQDRIVKFVRRLKKELEVPPAESSDPVTVTLAILDGKLAQRCMLADIFFEKLSEIADNKGRIDRDCFSSYLAEIGVDMSSSQIRDLFNGLDHKNSQKRRIDVSMLRNKMISTYKYIGGEGSRYKKYTSACHGIMVFHDVFTNQMVFENDMTKKKMLSVAMDHFIACDVVKERRRVHEEKKKDLEGILREFSVIKIQRCWRARVAVSKTKLRIKLRVQKNAHL